MRLKIRWWYIAIVLAIVVGAILLSNITIIGSKCQGYCSADAQLLLNAKTTCENDLHTSEPTIYDVVCKITTDSGGGGCLSCKECRTHVCTLPGPCEGGWAHYTCMNECTGEIIERQYECEDEDECKLPYHVCSDGSCKLICIGGGTADKCDSDGDCNDADPSTTDKCEKVGSVGDRYYDCTHTEIPYYDDKITCETRSYFGIANGYEWRENTVEKCTLGLFCHEESEPYCALRPDFLLVSIIIGVVLTSILGLFVFKQIRRR